MYYTLGIGGFSHDSSAALLEDGKLAAAVQEERLSRIKHEGGFPYKSINYCLDSAGIKLDDVSAVAFYAKKSNWDKVLFTLAKDSVLNPIYSISHIRNVAVGFGRRLYMSAQFRAEYERFLVKTKLDRSKFHFYDHHSCHAASAFLCSKYDNAIILCIDSVGDGKTTSGWIGRGNSIIPVDLKIRYPHSIAKIYAKITEFLGFHSLGDEYKVMGLAAYGKPSRIEELRKLVRFLPNGEIKLDMNYFTYHDGYGFSSKFYDVFGLPRGNNTPVDGNYADIAASIQALFEEVVMHHALYLKKSTGIRNLCLCGGTALNSKCNGKLVLTGEFDNIFIPPAASDLGTSIGAALLHWNQKLNKPRSFVLETDALGPRYDDPFIKSELEKYNLKYVETEDPSIAAAKLISKGRIIGWFQGRMEFGPRALGYRSILADTRKAEIKNKINSTIKFREEFRPFAPSILRECVKDYFEKDINCPFMTFTLMIKPDRQSEIQGVCHVDGSGRLQSVAENENPAYYRLIKEFHKITGVPVVLNTSFNLAGEPIVCSPYDAIRTFFTSGMNDLIIGKYILSKD
ncbi:MAG: hypothetical protein A2X48_04570 [Lentisphaerae bacterium GWF2_49_21]|nr:MAG: hypothetical protein A2X48_04570 [Lentisphaerae bacterium GWF2_49_21]